VDHADNVRRPMPMVKTSELGINGKHFLVSNMMKKCQGTYPNPPKPPIRGFAWVSTRHLLHADDLAAGSP
jgi:hypothetical protein